MIHKSKDLLAHTELRSTLRMSTRLIYFSFHRTANLRALVSPVSKRKPDHTACGRGMTCGHDRADAYRAAGAGVNCASDGRQHFRAQSRHRRLFFHSRQADLLPL